MTDIARATPTDIDALVKLESALFAEDAGQHDPYSDTTWPNREGRKDIEDLIASPDGIVLAARREDVVVGLLVGCAVQSSPTRQPVEYGILRSLYIAKEGQRGAIGPSTPRDVSCGQCR